MFLLTNTLDDKRIYTDTIKKNNTSTSTFSWIGVAYLFFKEFLIFTGQIFLMYITCFLVQLVSSMLYNYIDFSKKIADEIEIQREAASRIVKGKMIFEEFSLSKQYQLINDDVIQNKYLLYCQVIIIPIALAFIYLMFLQLNLRSKIRALSLITAFIAVNGYYFILEFNQLLNEGNGYMFFINIIVPFVICFLISVNILLAPKQDNFEKYN